MSDALTIALSGLNAQKQRLDVAANNVANVATAGRVPTAADPASTVYRPFSVSLTALTVGGSPGGVQGQVSQDQSGFSLSYDPTNIYANEQGLIAIPNVDLTKELVNLIETKLIYKANLSVIKTEKKMTDDLLDTIA